MFHPLFFICVIDCLFKTLESNYISVEPDSAPRVIPEDSDPRTAFMLLTIILIMFSDFGVFGDNVAKANKTDWRSLKKLSCFMKVPGLILFASPICVSLKNSQNPYTRSQKIPKMLIKRRESLK